MVIGLSGTPHSDLLHLDGTTVLNGTAGVGASEQIHVPMNQRETGLSNDYNHFICICIYV